MLASQELWKHTMWPNLGPKLVAEVESHFVARAGRLSDNVADGLAHCPMPNAHAQCPMIFQDGLAHAQCPLPNARCPMPTASPMPNLALHSTLYHCAGHSSR